MTPGDLDPVAALAGRLVVSCQAPAGHPMRDSAVIARLAQCALLGGAGGLRINGADDLEAVRPLTDVPVIGLHKVRGDRRDVITPTPDLAAVLARAGADIVAVDATREARADIAAAVRAAADTTALPIMADVSTLDEGLEAWDASAALVGTTLSGYTPYTTSAARGPDLELVEALARRGVRVVAEGRFHTPEQVVAALDRGAYAVVVGAAITDPVAITQRFEGAARSVAGDQVRTE